MPVATSLPRTGPFTRQTLSRFFLAILTAAAWLDVHAQSSLPPCPAQTGTFGKAFNTPSTPACFGKWSDINGDTYVGEWRFNKRHGQGTYTYADGRKYVGEFKDDTFNGQGTFTFPDGREYVGDFKDGLINRGTYTYADGRKYVGEFKDDTFNGQGTLVWSNGDKYIGEWSKGQFGGLGTLRYATGGMYIGEWVDGLRDGRGSGIYPSGERYVGDHRGNKRNGEGIEYLPNGKVKRSGMWIDDELVRAYQIATRRFPFNPDELFVATASPEKPAPTPSLPEPSDRRVALIIGNARYTNASALINPPSDAASVASALRDAGFQTVTVKNDLSQQATLTALREFATQADSADWAVVYYAGHGIEFGGVNYLIPTDARLKADRDIDLEGVDLGKVMAAVEGAKRLRLIILDACRDNPFASQMRRTLASRSIGRGLARVEPEPGTLIAYAAKHGETAIDGVANRNSPFADALVKRIRQTPPIEVRRLFDYVRDDVLKSTGKKQQPFSYGSISAEEDFFFVQPK